MYKSYLSAIMKRFMLFDTSLNILRRRHESSFHRVFFIFFLFSLPFSIRKVLAIFSPDGVFNEYMDFSVYFSDILLIATLLIYILENKSNILSIVHWRRMFHVEHLFLPIFIPSFFIVWSGISIFWSESALLALSTFLRLLEGYFLYLYIVLSNVPRGTFETKTRECSTWNNFDPQSIRQTDEKLFHVEQLSNPAEKNVPRGTIFSLISHFFRKCSTWNIWQGIFSVIIISAILQSFIAIIQFLLQKSIGLTFLGESIFSVFDPGVAKIVINGDIFVRSYGFFPHPNILGGFLALSLVITLFYPILFRIKMFHVEQLDQKQQNVPRGTFEKPLAL